MVTDELENGLHSAFAKTADSISMPPQARQRLLQRDYHPKTSHRVLAAGLAAAAIAAAAITIPLAAGSGSQPATAGPVIQIASHAFRLPADYHLTAATSPPCHAILFFALPDSILPHHGPVTQNPPYGGQMKAAASASGGCILAVLAPRYTPAASKPDPEAPAGAQPVQIGRYHGFLYQPRVFAEHGIKPGWIRFTQLFVQLPAGGGTMRDLVIGARQLSGTELIKIAASGLSA